MSELLKKYKAKSEYLENLTEAYRDLIALALEQLKAYIKGDGELEEALETLRKRVKIAKNIFQVEQLKKDYAELGKRVAQRLREKPPDKEAAGLGLGGFMAGLGALFTGGDKPEAAPKSGAAPGQTPPAGDALVPYVTLLDGFAKGSLLISDESYSFYQPLRAHRQNAFANLSADEAARLALLLYNFFIGKSNEAATIESERAELKNIIGSLTGYIRSLAVSSEEFGGKLDQYAARVRAATDLAEIRKIQHAILAETLEIQKVNNTVRAQLTDHERRLDEASRKIARLEQDLELARQEKSVDALTQVFNRGYFDEALRQAVAEFTRDGRPGALIMFDIDHFKSFNDSYGHQAGDQVLQVVAEITQESVRVSDIVARYGGEEFAIILKNTPLDGALTVAEAARNAIRGHEFVARGKTLRITVSLGVSAFEQGDAPEAVIARADRRLYTAKKEGRDRVNHTA
ncbi:MAG: GGDEF domain-containing protein [Nitrospinae bacterium]|nr:GGDEF domain-containing protein [Nitrospinota bacterium]